MHSPERAYVERWKQDEFRSWSEAAPAWRRWSAELAAWMREHTDALVEIARLEPGMQILDLACGTGEPAITLAKAVQPNGHVTATDFAADMVVATEENACEQGLTNLTAKQADAGDLPFPDQAFDVVTCRFGVMYFPDVQRALLETYRVLRPGGHAVFAVVSVAEPDPDLPDFVEPILQRAGSLPEPDPGAPHTFRFAEPGALAAEFRKAGFYEVTEEIRTVKETFPGPPEQFWDFFQEIAQPFLEPILNAVPQEQRAEMMAEVLANLQQCYDGRFVVNPARTIFVSGVR